LINTHNGIKEKGVNPVNINNYPSIKIHLDKYFPMLEKRLDKGDTPYNLRNCAYMEDFYKQKIIYPCIMASEPAFIFDENQFFTPAPGNIISGNNLKYLLAFLCSKLCYFSLRKFYMGGGIESELKTNRLLLLPIPKPNEFIEKEILNILKEMQEKDFKEKIDLLDKLDLIVFSTYKLNKYEINFIKSFQYN